MQYFENKSLNADAPGAEYCGRHNQHTPEIATAEFLLWDTNTGDPLLDRLPAPTTGDDSNLQPLAQATKGSSASTRGERWDTGSRT